MHHRGRSHVGTVVAPTVHRRHYRIPDFNGAGYEIESNSFPNGGVIPDTFPFTTSHPHECMNLGDIRNPSLAWSGVPDGTRSFAIVCHDRDVPSRAADVNQEGARRMHPFPASISITGSRSIPTHLFER
jgi:phosphatidylethanolamine-binding protein (PEBP) family uncharacterized protein